MYTQITLKQEYQSLDQILKLIQNSSPYEVSIEYDVWDMQTDASGQIAKCILVKKSSMHGLKLELDGKQQLHASYVIPNKALNAILGPNKKRYRNPLEILSSKLLSMAIAGQQKKAFTEMSTSLNNLAH